jgi:flagellar L-ring protein precursor FlgH
MFMRHLPVACVVTLICVIPALAQTAPVQPAQPVGMQPFPTPAQQLRASGGSLMRAAIAQQAGQAAQPGEVPQAQVAQASLFAVTPPEPRVLKKHDIVQIIIREESSFSSEGNTDLKKEATLNAAINELFKIETSPLRLTSGGISAPLAVDMTGTREMKGEGSLDRRDSFNARVAAEVLDVKPNGTVVLQARKKIKTDDEEQMIVLSGTCRAEDITSDNTVLSNQLHDLEATKSHKGAVRDNTKRGWLAKLLDAANPF